MNCPKCNRQTAGRAAWCPVHGDQRDLDYERPVVVELPRESWRTMEVPKNQGRLL